MALYSDEDAVVTGAPLSEEQHPSLDGDAQRARLTRRTKHHTYFVKFLRLVLPLASVVVVGLYGMSAYRTAEWLDTLPPLPIPSIFPDKLTMDNPHYSGYNDDGSKYNVTAKTATQDFSRPGVILLQGISGELVDAKDATTTLAATRGEYFQKKQRLTLAGEIDIRSTDGMRAKLKSATVLTKTGVIRTTDPVFVAMRSSTLRANEMTIWQKQKEAEFNGDVRAHLKQEQSGKGGSDGAGTAASRARAAKASAGAMFSSSGAPIDINSQSLKVSNEDNRAVFSGNVRARQDDALIETHELEVHFEPALETAPAPGTSAGAGAGAPTKGSSALGAASGKVKMIVAKHPIKITRGADQTVTSENAQFFVADQRAILEGRVVIVGGQDRSSSSDRAVLHQLEETVLLEGNVIVRQGKNSLRGRKLFVDRKRGLLKLNSPPGDGAGPGRVNATLHREPSEGARKRKAATPAKSQGAGAVSFKTDPDAPIHVEADSLNVDNRARAAVFRGRVVAAQGTFQIRSATLSIQYTGQIEVADPNASGTAQGQPELKTIVARDNVVVTSQTGQTATGDVAEFDVVANSLVISGAVTLAQGSNRIKGSRLRIDMDTGVTVVEHDSNTAGGGWTSSVDGGGAQANSNDGQPPPGFNARGGQPNAVFYPFQLKKNKAKKKKTRKKGRASTTRQPAAGTNAPPSGASGLGPFGGPSSWSTTSSPAN